MSYTSGVQSMHYMPTNDQPGLSPGASPSYVPANQAAAHAAYAAKGGVSYASYTYRALTEREHQDTLRLLDVCGKIAHETIHPPKENRSQEGGSSWSFAPFSLRTGPTFSLNVEATKTKAQIDNENRRDAVLIGALVAMACSFLWGMFTAQYENMQKGLYTDLKELKSTWNCNRFKYNFVASYQQKMDRVIERTFAIMNDKLNNQIYKIAYAATLVLSGGLLVAGGLAAHGTMMSVGAGIGIFSTVAMLGRWGYRCFNEDNSINASRIQNGVADLRSYETEIKKHIVA